MIIFIIRTLITLIGVILGNILVAYLQNNDIISFLIPKQHSNSILAGSVHFGIVFCVAGFFFLISSVVAIGLQKKSKDISKESNPQKIMAVILSLILGLTISLLFMPLINIIMPNNSYFYTIFVFLSYIIICAIVMSSTINFLSDFFEARLNVLNVNYISNDEADINNNKSKILIDTNIFIDGRIYNIAKTGILNEILIVPDFVLNELQYIADSKDEMLRKKGKRGLDILNKLKKLDTVQLEILESNKKGKVNVDELLTILSKQMNAKILTNDANLCKVAKIKNISTINLNELSIAMKPDFLPGETFFVKPIKKGRLQTKLYHT